MSDVPPTFYYDKDYGPYVLSPRGVRYYLKPSSQGGGAFIRGRGAKGIKTPEELQSIMSDWQGSSQKMRQRLANWDVMDQGNRGGPRAVQATPYVEAKTVGGTPTPATYAFENAVQLPNVPLPSVAAQQPTAWSAPPAVPGPNPKTIFGYDAQIGGPGGVYVVPRTALESTNPRPYFLGDQFGGGYPLNRYTEPVEGYRGAARYTTPPPELNLAQKFGWTPEEMASGFYSGGVQPGIAGPTAALPSQPIQTQAALNTQTALGAAEPAVVNAASSTPAGIPAAAALNQGSAMSNPNFPPMLELPPGGQDALAAQLERSGFPLARVIPGTGGAAGFDYAGPFGARPSAQYGYGQTFSGPLEQLALPAGAGGGGGAGGAGGLGGDLAGGLEAGGEGAANLGRLGQLKNFAMANPYLIAAGIAPEVINRVLPSKGGAGDVRQILSDVLSGAAFGGTAGALIPIPGVGPLAGAIGGGLLGGARAVGDILFDWGGNEDMSAGDAKKKLAGIANRTGLQSEDYNTLFDLYKQTNPDATNKAIQSQVGNILMQNWQLKQQQDAANLQSNIQRAADTKAAMAMQSQTQAFMAPYSQDLISSGIAQAGLLGKLAQSAPPEFQSLFQNQALQQLTMTNQLNDAYSLQASTAPADYLANENYKRQQAILQLQYNVARVNAAAGNSGGGGGGLNSVISQLAQQGQGQQQGNTGLTPLGDQTNSGLTPVQSLASYP